MQQVKVATENTDMFQFCSQSMTLKLLKRREKEIQAKDKETISTGEYGCMFSILRHKEASAWTRTDKYIYIYIYTNLLCLSTNVTHILECHTYC